MTNWKINQRIFKALGVKKDILGIDIPDNKIRPVIGPLYPAIVNQFYDLEDIYVPAKSYCVAVVYAIELANDFGGSVLDYLNDVDLLLDDKYYVPYTKDPHTYDSLLSDRAWIKSPMYNRIYEYYKKEMLLEGFHELSN
jgi:hypothetical protein